MDELKKWLKDNKYQIPFQKKNGKWGINGAYLLGAETEEEAIKKLIWYIEKSKPEPIPLF